MLLPDAFPVTNSLFIRFVECMEEHGESTSPTSLGIIIIIISVWRPFFHVKHGLDGFLNFSLSFGRVTVWNLHDPKYPTVPNALSGIPLLVCSVKHRQLHKGNSIHLNNQTKHGMSHLCHWLWLTSISVASYDMHSYSGSILSSPNPQGDLYYILLNLSKSYC